VEDRNVWHQTERLNAAKIDIVLLQAHNAVMSLEGLVLLASCAG
jgi:hypothetical protein